MKTSQKITTSILLTLVALLATQALAIEPISLQAVGPRLSTIDSRVPYLGRALGYGAVADLGDPVPGYNLNVAVHYWRASTTHTGQDMDFLGYTTPSGTAYFSDFSLEALFRKVFPFADSRFAPFAGAGPVVHFLSGGGSARYEGETMDAANGATRLGLNLGGGTSYRINDRVDLVGELKYVAVSQGSQLILQVGVMWNL